MRLYLHGHEYKYAVEQMLLTMFPAERPEYPDGKPEGERLEISLSHTAQRTTACCTPAHKRRHIQRPRPVYKFRDD